MKVKKQIFVIIGSASKDSANQKIVNYIVGLTKKVFEFTILEDLKILPHFDPEASINNPPGEIIRLRENIEKADGVLICSPEYVFSIPSGLKNVIEWCVSTTVFSDKPVGLITASASGQKGHEELQLIMNTVMARFTGDTTLLIQGVKGKISPEGEITDVSTVGQLNRFIEAFKDLVANEN